MKEFCTNDNWKCFVIRLTGGEASASSAYYSAVWVLTLPMNTGIEQGSKNKSLID